MGGAILSGFGMGLLVSVVVLAAVSLSTPLPEEPAPDAAAVRVEEPAAPETLPAEAPAEPEPAPAPEAGSGSAEAPEMSEQPAAPAEDVAPAPSAPEADPATASETGPDDEARLPAPDAAPAPETPAAEEAPATPLAAPSIDALRPASPVAPDAAPEEGRPERIALPQIDAAPAPREGAEQVAGGTADQAPPVLETDPAPAPAVAVRPAPPGPPAAPTAPPPRFIARADTVTATALPRVVIPPQPADTLGAIDTAPAPVPAAPAPEAGPDRPSRLVLPQVAPPAAPEEAAAGTPMPDALPAPDAAGTVPRRLALPQVADSLARLDALDGSADDPGSGFALPQVADTLAGMAAGVEPPAADSAPAEALADPAPAGPPDALRDNAVAFEAPPGRPLMAVVLIDDPDSPLDPDLLTRFTFPVSFAIDPLRPDAAARAAELRAAGFEVVILGSGVIPEGATPSDVEVALSSAIETMPQAVAVMDDPDGRIQSDRAVLEATVSALGGSGHGLLAFPRGLNAAEQTARREDLPAATFFRMLDDEDQRATVITRYLARVAFAAGQDGAVVVAGRTRPDTVTALFSWALGSRSEQVTLAPVSAVLQRLAE